MNRPVLLLLLPLLLGAPALHAQSAVDERAIVAVASELDTAVDTKDWERVRALFLDRITVELPATEPTDMDADALIGMWRANLHERKSSFHLRGGEIVTFDGADSAVLHSKAHMWNRVAGLRGDDMYEVWGDHRYELDRTEDGWRIRRFAFVPRLERGNLAVFEHRLPVKEPAAEPSSAEEGGDAAAEGADEAAADDDEKAADGG